MDRRSRTTVGIALALVAALWLLVWLTLAVLVPLFEEAPCSGVVWAPAVLPRPGGFVLYYTTRAHDPDRECLSRAVSKEPGGPFVDDSSGPLVCPPDGGAIDPSPFVAADGRAYLLWKSDAAAGIVAQQLAPDGLSLVGDQQPILQADQAWEAGVVEAPSMVGYDGRYYLFFSGNNWSTAGYAIGYAVCESPTAPCTKPADPPRLPPPTKPPRPGGAALFRDEQGQL